MKDLEETRNSLQDIQKDVNNTIREVDSDLTETGSGQK